MIFPLEKMAASLDIFCFLNVGNGGEVSDELVLERGLGKSRWRSNEGGVGFRSDAIDTMVVIMSVNS